MQLERPLGLGAKPEHDALLEARLVNVRLNINWLGIRNLHRLVSGDDEQIRVCRRKILGRDLVAVLRDALVLRVPHRRGLTAACELKLLLNNVAYPVTYFCVGNAKVSKPLYLQLLFVQLAVQKRPSLEQEAQSLLRLTVLLLLAWNFRRGVWNANLCVCLEISLITELGQVIRVFPRHHRVPSSRRDERERPDSAPGPYDIDFSGLY